MKMTTSTYTKYKVRRMNEFGSKNWGVYVNADTRSARLVEGGFFHKDSALELAEDMNQDFAAKI